MQNWWTIWQLGKMKQREIIKEAELRRLAEQGGSNRRETDSGFCAVLGRLGNLLVCVGLFLQTRYRATAKKKCTQPF